MIRTPDGVLSYFTDKFSVEYDLATVLSYERQEWFDNSDLPTDQTRLHHPFGFLAPWRDIVGGLYVAVCPELLLDQTDILTDDEFVEYLTVISFHLYMHLAEPDRMDIELEQQIDNLLVDRWPGAMRILNSVQMNALSAPARKDDREDT